mmetsp:Transcript_22838/g.46372  ORF Transcript_22838/g.46372 Transcript_22838/m.46372 type:complete len:201 (+) Transcript_22838:356-958(+)
MSSTFVGTVTLPSVSLTASPTTFPTDPFSSASMSMILSTVLTCPPAASAARSSPSTRLGSRGLSARARMDRCTPASPFTASAPHPSIRGGKASFTFCRSTSLFPSYMDLTMPSRALCRSFLLSSASRPPLTRPSTSSFPAHVRSLALRASSPSLSARRRESTSSLTASARARRASWNRSSPSSVDRGLSGLLISVPFSSS